MFFNFKIFLTIHISILPKFLFFFK